MPEDAEAASAWQHANRDWWENHPMRYDWKGGITQEEFSKGFYQEIDQRFFHSAQQFLPSACIPFDSLIDYKALRSLCVLEIGTGNGSHAQLLAEHAGSYTGIDITEYAVKSTSTRLKLLGISATVVRMDAERMEFPDNSFDFIWSWGVIHHSSNTRNVLREMHRVLRPGGKAVTMVYYRGWWCYYICSGLVYGVVKGDLFKTRSLHATVQRLTDGALARYYTPDGWTVEVEQYFQTNRQFIVGAKAELVPFPGGRLKEGVLRLIPDAVGRFFTNSCRMGSMLISSMDVRK